MSRFYSHLNTAKTILSRYRGDIPFSAFIKNFFSQEKKYGSQDRRTVSSLCYNYFRIGKAPKNQDIEERLLTGMFLCTDLPNEILQNKKPEWNVAVTLPLTEKVTMAGIDIAAIFPFTDQLSEDIDIQAFNISFLIQPKLFIRLRPGKETIGKKKLETAEIDFEKINDNCLAIDNGTKLEEILHINSEAVIQDANSQRVSELILAAGKYTPIHVWDCCAASGGKSIMAGDMLSGIRLTVSDVRQTIIQNLQKRFKEAGIKDYISFVADLNNYKSLQAELQDKRFDLIICDAPCSGSGTWSRTPEQLISFQENEITKYSNLQKSICTNTIPFLKKGGYFLYITCSVFRQENEEVVEFIKQQNKVALVKMELFKGYDIKADTMFAALFQLAE